MFSEEAKLIEECIKGSRKAQKELYDKYNALFFSLCLLYTHTREEAEDILIMGFMEIFESLPNYKQEGSFEGWMKKILIHKAIDYFRANKKYQVNVDIEEVETEGSIINTVVQDMDAKYILKQIQAMPDGYQQVFNLYAIEGYKHIEIAKLLNISESTSKSQYSKAKKWLQQKLKDYKS